MIKFQLYTIYFFGILATFRLLIMVLFAFNWMVLIMLPGYILFAGYIFLHHDTIINPPDLRNKPIDLPEPSHDDHR